MPVNGWMNGCYKAVYKYVYISLSVCIFALDSDLAVVCGMVRRNYNKISEDEVETFSRLKQKNVSCVGKGF